MNGAPSTISARRLRVALRWLGAAAVVATLIAAATDLWTRPDPRPARGHRWRHRH